MRLTCAYTGPLGTTKRKKREMNALKIGILMIGLIVMISCENSNKKSTGNADNVEDTIKEKPNPTISKKKERTYLSQKELYEFVNEALSLTTKSKYRTPFDTLKFDKVIAYDFDGSEEPYPSVINHRNEKFAPVILRQVELKENQIEFLLDFVTDNKTYGEVTAACFVPHLGFVFYEGEKRKFVIDVCLDCNYLISSTEIPATQHKKMEFENGSSYGLRGFSKKGKEKIIELSKQLNLDYGKIENK